jgi:iron complex transport system permease protein
MKAIRLSLDRAPKDNAPNGALSPAVPRAFWLVIGLAVLGALSLLSLMLGARPMSAVEVWGALSHYNPTSADHIIVYDYRMPRTLLGLLCGAAFAVSGALIQAATRNPLADPGVLGVNAGAALSVSLAIGVFGTQSISLYLWAAFAGAIGAAVLVYVLGATGRGGATPVRLVLSGVALSAVLGGVTSSITLLNPHAFDTMRLWAIGSLAGRNMDVVTAVAPFIALGLGLAIAVARPLNAVSLGNDVARSLGADLLRAKILVVLAVTLLAGAGTAAVGPIGFIGLMVPHIVRWFTGPDQRWIVALTIVFGPVLLLAADVIGRLVVFPGELEAGIVTAFIGAPVLILLARRKKARGL